MRSVQTCQLHQLRMGYRWEILLCERILGAIPQFSDLLRDSVAAYYLLSFGTRTSNATLRKFNFEKLAGVMPAGKGKTIECNSYSSFNAWSRAWPRVGAGMGKPSSSRAL